MSFVHGNHGDPRVEGKVKKAVREKAFGRNVNNRITSLSCKLQSLIILVCGQGTVQIGGVDSRLVERPYLVLHEGNERGYNQGNPLHDQCRNLKT